MEYSGSSNTNSISTKCKRYPEAPPVCYCGKKTSVLKSWTFENPGRRFFKCEVHGFYKWADEEIPYGWQKESLLEARDEIWKLKGMVRELKEGRAAASSSRVVVNTEPELVQNGLTATEKLRLEAEIVAGRETQKVMKQFIMIWWGGFVAVTALIIKMLK